MWLWIIGILVVLVVGCIAGGWLMLHWGVGPIIGAIFGTKKSKKKGRDYRLKWYEWPDRLKWYEWPVALFLSVVLWIQEKIIDKI